MNPTVTDLRTILYVEDDLHVRTTAKLVLEVIGNFKVRDCSSGHQAVLAAENFYPELILLDVMMPELDGLATLKALRQLPHMAEVPALFVTGLTMPEDLARYMGVGAIGVIAKPLVPLRLAGQVAELWELRLQAA